MVRRTYPASSGWEGPCRAVRALSLFSPAALVPCLSALLAHARSHCFQMRQAMAATMRATRSDVKGVSPVGCSATGGRRSRSGTAVARGGVAGATAMTAPSASVVGGGGEAGGATVAGRVGVAARGVAVGGRRMVTAGVGDGRRGVARSRGGLGADRVGGRVTRIGTWGVLVAVGEVISVGMGGGRNVSVTVGGG